MKPLTLEIHGTTSFNRGAELKTVTIAERVRARFPHCRVVVPHGYGGFSARSGSNFLTTWELSSGVRTKNLLRFSPNPLKRIAGIIDPGEVDIVVEASGLLLSDHLGPQPALDLLKKMNRRDRRNQPLVLLPQSYGPFQNPDVAKAARRVMERASLVCARDDASFAAASTLVERSKLRRFPDVAVDATASFPRDFETPPHFCALVPNVTLLERLKAPQDYLNILSVAVGILRQQKLNPVFILHHDSHDQRVVNGLNELAPDVPVWEVKDSRSLRGLLGRSTLVIASRYQALLGALIQAVPSIGLSASHEVPELMSDFDCGDLAMGEPLNSARFQQELTKLVDSTVRLERSERLRQRALQLRNQSREFWGELYSFLSGNLSSDAS